MKTALLPIIKEILILLLAIYVFLVLYDYFAKGKTFKDAALDRLILVLFQSGLGWLVYLIGGAAVFFLVYSIFFVLFWSYIQDRCI